MRVSNSTMSSSLRTGQSESSEKRARTVVRSARSAKGQRWMIWSSLPVSVCHMAPRGESLTRPGSALPILSSTAGARPGFRL